MLSSMTYARPLKSAPLARRRIVTSALVIVVALCVSLAGCCRKKPAPSPYVPTGPSLPGDPCPGVVYPPQATSPYVLPYPVGARHNVRQGNCNDANSHNARTGEQYAYDFEMPVGSPVTAARAGRVFYAEGKFNDDQHGLDQANGVFIDHGDRTFAKYGHFTHGGALVAVGDRVTAGQTIGKSGNSGLSKAPHMHFAVGECPPGAGLGTADCYTVPVTFRNTRPHPRGLIGSPTSEVGAGEHYQADPYKH
jgi:murein DD-endopeptidase MepM/ murein hydrolase activator NlpD